MVTSTLSYKDHSMSYQLNHPEWVIADPLSDPLCQLLHAEEEDEEIEALVSTELAWQHVTDVCDYEH